MEKRLVLAGFLFLAIVLVGCAKPSETQSNFKVITEKTESGTQTTLVANSNAVRVTFETRQPVNLDGVSITARDGLTKIDGLSLPPGVTKKAQVAMPSGSRQVCVDDSERAALSAGCTDPGEVIIPCPGSAGGFTCSIITGTLFEVSGLTHTAIGSRECGVPGDPLSIGLPPCSGCTSSADCAANTTNKACISGVCGCNTDADCGGSAPVCDTATKGCIAKSVTCPAGLEFDSKTGFCRKSTGQACTSSSECISGFCVSNFCSACSTKCEAANGVASCISGSCRIASCNAPFKDCDLIYADGCETNSNTDANNCGSCGLKCPAGVLCTAGVCATKKANGLICSAGSECSGGLCTDGYCCDKACFGECEACNIAGVQGNCTNIPAGADPDTECSKQDASTCGRTGVCSGTGACQKYSAGTECGDSSCTNLGYVPAPECNAAGTCASEPAVNCDDSNACTTDTCDSDSGCAHTTVSCDDGNECSVETCNSAAGCEYAPVEDQTLCTGGYCMGGSCITG